MKAPKIIIKTCNDIARYYIYRGSEKELTKNICDYINKEPIGICENTGITNEIEFIDNRAIQQVDISKYKDNPITIGKPNVSSVVKIKDTVSKHIPYVTLNVSDVKKEIFNFYRVIGEGHNGEVSEISDISVCGIIEDEDNIISMLQVKDNDVWNDMFNIELEKDIDILKYGETDYNQFGSIFNSDVANLTEEDVSINSKYVRSDNVLIISIANLWHVNNSEKHYRGCKQFRVACTVGDDNILSSATIGTGKQYSPIDKLEILRCEDNGSGNDINPGDKNIVTKLIIRSGGIYSNSDFETMQFNEEHMNGDFLVVNSDNIYKNIKIIDKGILPNKKYKYTFRCYDHSGDVSEPLTIISSI